MNLTNSKIIKLTIRDYQDYHIWFSLSKKKPKPNKQIEIEVDCRFWKTQSKTLKTKTLIHNGRIMIKIDGESGFFRAMFIEDFNQNLRWRYIY
jgi:hypothetical protein